MKGINARKTIHNLQFLHVCCLPIWSASAAQLRAVEHRDAEWRNGSGIFCHFPKRVRCIPPAPALGERGRGSETALPFQMGPNFWERDPYPADGTRRVGGAACL